MISKDGLTDLVELLQDPAKFLNAIDVFEDRRMKAEAAEEAAEKIKSEVNLLRRDVEQASAKLIEEGLKERAQRQKDFDTEEARLREAWVGLRAQEEKLKKREDALSNAEKLFQERSTKLTNDQADLVAAKSKNEKLSANLERGMNDVGDMEARLRKLEANLKSREETLKARVKALGADL